MSTQPKEPPTPGGYDARRYWSERLERLWSLKGVGYVGYTEAYNRYLYRAKVRALRKALRVAGLDVKGRDVLDLGSGTGFWLRWYAAAGAHSVCGFELAAPAVQRLRTALPDIPVYEGDIGAAWPTTRRFDVISAFDVFYHIADPEGFRTALTEALAHLVPGGWLILSDRLGAEDFRSAAHVRFHGLESYRQVVEAAGGRIEAVQPMYRLMNGGIGNARAIRRSERLVRLAVAFENLTAPLLYALDGALLGRGQANLSILMARKVEP